MSGSVNLLFNFFVFLEILYRNRPVPSAFRENRAVRVDETIYKKYKNCIEKIYSFYILNIFLIYCKRLKYAFKSQMSESLNSKKGSERLKFSVGRVLHLFSYWFPKAMKYGLRADAIYHSDEKTATILIPMPVIRDGNYTLWLFRFVEVERITPSMRDLIILEARNEFPSSVFRLVERETHFIVADRIRGKITPKFGKRSIYVIKSTYSWKVYEIAAKSIEGFVSSFRRNVKYGEDLLELCDEMERFAAILRKEAEGLKVKFNSTQPSPTHHPDADEFLSKLSRAEVMK